MSYDEDWPDNTQENRRAMVRKTIHPVSIEELKLLGEKLFPVVSDPWCERFNEFLKTHAGAKFHRAQVPTDIEVIYCREFEKGIWFLPGRAMGVVQPDGLKMLREIVDAL